MTRYNEFWAWLVYNHLAIETLLINRQFDVVENLISENLDSINPEISWEIGLVNNEVELTLSAEGNEAVGKVLGEMFADCPSIPKWKLYRYKQPKKISSLSRIIASQGYQIDLEKVDVQVALNSLTSKVDVILISLDFNKISSKRLFELSFLILDGILGEEMVEKWIGSINTSIAQDNNTVVALSDLRNFMNDLTV
jgi:hypothetical protein